MFRPDPNRTPSTSRSGSIAPLGRTATKVSAERASRAAMLAMSSANTSNRLISTGRSSSESRLASNASVLSPASRARSIDSAVVSVPLRSPSTGPGKGKGLRNNPMITLLSSRRAISAAAARRTSSEIPPFSQTITSLIIATSRLDHGAVMSECIAARAALHQQIENAEALLPVLGLRVPQTALHDLEGARKRQAQPAYYLWQSSLGFFTVSEVQRRLRDETVEDRP